MFAPPPRTGPYSAYEMKTILSTLHQEQSNDNRLEVYRKVSEALSENVFGRTPLQIQKLYGDLRKLYVNERRFRKNVQSPTQDGLEELKIILEENNMLHLASIMDNTELLRLLVAIFDLHK